MRSCRYARRCRWMGGVIVTTPQEASLGVVRKGIAMFEKVNVPILGIVEKYELLHGARGASGWKSLVTGAGGTEAARRGIDFFGRGADLRGNTRRRGCGEAGGDEPLRKRLRGRPL